MLVTSKEQKQITIVVDSVSAGPCRFVDEVFFQAKRIYDANPKRHNRLYTTWPLIQVVDTDGIVVFETRTINQLRPWMQNNLDRIELPKTGPVYKVGDKVVPFQKTVGRGIPFVSSPSLAEAKRIGQPYLFVQAVLAGGLLKLGVNEASGFNEFFNPTDINLYEGAVE